MKENKFQRTAVLHSHRHPLHPRPYHRHAAAAQQPVLSSAERSYLENPTMNKKDWTTERVKEKSIINGHGIKEKENMNLCFTARHLSFTNQFVSAKQKRTNIVVKINKIAQGETK